MNRLLDKRILTFAGTGVLLGILAVCGLALYLTVNQYRAVHGTLLEAYRRAAVSRQPELASHLEKTELEILTRMETGTEDLDSLLAKEALVEEPFFFLADGTVVAPLRRKVPPRSPYVSDEPRPPEYAEALRRALLPIPLRERVQALEEIQDSPEMAPRWRLRAASAVAAVTRQEGLPDQAAEQYRSLFNEFGTLLYEALSPSYLQLVMARQESLVESSQVAEARQLVLDALERIREGSVSTTFEEEQFFFTRARKLFQSSGGEPPGLLDELQRRQWEQRFALVAVETVRDWVFAPASLAGESRKARGPQHFFQETAGKPVLAVWRWVEPGSTRSGAAVVGFLADLSRLETELTDRLTGGDPESPLQVRAQRPDPEFTSLASCSGELWFLSIGLSTDAWAALVGAARQPFLLTGVLIALLALILLSTAVIFFRSIRREVLQSSLKAEFVANVSHELKTPLALIRLFGETLLLGRVVDPQRRTQYYEIITRESERLSQLISNVLSFSSIDAGKKTYQLDHCEIGAVVRQTVDSYRYHLEEQGFTCNVQIDDDLPAAWADSDAVAQALINLLQNAIKYSGDEKDITVRVWGQDGTVRASVSDRGVGISPQEQSLIWQDYYRSREARRLGTRGSGLGLSLVQHIMRAHGGRVELDSEAGKGSVFTLVFPVEPPYSEVQSERED